MTTNHHAAAVTTERLRSLLSEATPGPWRVTPHDDESTATVDAGETPNGTLVAACWAGHGGADSDPDAALIVAAVNALPVLLDVVEAARLLVPDAQALFERQGVVFDKWPPADEQMPPYIDGRRTWTPELLAALDPETRWQGVAFSLYVQMTTIVALARLDTLP